jgi:hypothetical protein
MLAYGIDLEKRTDTLLLSGEYKIKIVIFSQLFFIHYVRRKFETDAIWGLKGLRFHGCVLPARNLVDLWVKPNVCILLALSL